MARRPPPHQNVNEPEPEPEPEPVPVPLPDPDPDPGARETDTDTGTGTNSGSGSGSTGIFGGLSLLAFTSVAALLALAPSCLDRRDEQDPNAVAGRCASCHGDPARAGDFLQRSAPPRDLLGETNPAFPGVGAHQNHVHASTTHGAVACAECHVVPEDVDSPGHADDARPAEVVLGPLAATEGREPGYGVATRRCSDTWCHREAEAVWTEPRTSKAACGSCHGLPPPAPHPQIGPCARCHGEVVAEDGVSFVQPSRHVDGIVDVSFDESCTACHGSANPAPPTDLSGSSSTASPGVGAHQIHLLGTPRSRPVPCAECHLVPESALAEGHIDTPPPAELVFSGAAIAYGGVPGYAGGSCQATSCHGGTFPEGHLSGGTNTAPVWTKVDGTQATCGTCHALPPPKPHPRADLNPICSACHEDIAPDNATFVHPELHVDGVVTFTVP